MCFGSTNPKVASGADNHDQSHRALSYDLSDQPYPNKPVKSSGDGFFANTPYARSKEFQKSTPEAVKKQRMFLAQYSTL